MVVDLKTAVRKYTDLQAKASLQLSTYSYATSILGMGGPRACRGRLTPTAPLLTWAQGAGLA